LKAPEPAWISLTDVHRWVCSAFGSGEGTAALRRALRDGEIRARCIVPRTNKAGERCEVAASDWEAGRIRWAEGQLYFPAGRQCRTLNRDWVSLSGTTLLEIEVHRADLSNWIGHSPEAALTQSAIISTPAPEPRACLRKDLDKAYKERLLNGRIPTVAEDEFWRKQLGLPRWRMRELRAKHRDAEAKKGGHPKTKRRGV